MCFDVELRAEYNTSIVHLFLVHIGDANRASQLSLCILNSIYLTVTCIRVHTLVCVIYVHISTNLEVMLDGAYYLTS